MAIYIGNIAFFDDYTGAPFGAGPDSVGTPMLMGYPGDFMMCSVTFLIYWQTLNNKMTVDTTAQTFTRNDVGGSFITDGFKLNDTIVVTGASTNDGTYTIASVTQNVITTVESLTLNGVFSSVYIYGTTPITAFDFYYNQIGTTDQQTFTSLSDINSVQKFSGIATTSPGTVLSTNATSLGWWDNKVDSINSLPVITSYGASGDHKQIFTLTFPFLIQPFYLANQLASIRNAFLQGNNSALTFTPPSYFNNECLMFLYKIDGKLCATDTLAAHTTGLQSTPGNTGWFDSFFPNGSGCTGPLLTAAEYSVVSCTYADNATSLPLTTLDFDNKTDVTITIANSLGTGPLTAAPFVLNFMRLPTIQSEYQGFSPKNQSDFRKAFLHDRAKTTECIGLVNGDQFGTDYQALTNVQGLIVGGNLVITCTVDLGNKSKSTFANASDADRNYMFFVGIQDVGVSQLQDTNRNAIICDVNNSTTDTNDPALLVVTTDGTTDIHFFRYPDINVNPVTNFVDYIGANAYAKCTFLVAAGAQINNMRCRFESQVLSGSPPTVLESSFILEDWNNATTQFWDGSVSQLNVQQILPTSVLNGAEQYNVRSIRRDPANDVPGWHAYALFYPFQLGYSYWQQLQSVSDQFKFFPQNYWSIYTQGGTSQNILAAGLTPEIKFIISWDIQSPPSVGGKPGVVTQFEQVCDIAVHDDYGNLPGQTVTYSVFDTIGNNLNQVIPSNMQCEVEIEVDGTNVGVPPAPYNTCTGQITLIWDNGVKQLYDISSTEESLLPGTLWVTQPTLNITANKVIITAVLDVTQTSPPIQNYRVMGSLKYKI